MTRKRLSIAALVPVVAAMVGALLVLLVHGHGPAVTPKSAQSAQSLQHPVPTATAGGLPVGVYAPGGYSQALLFGQKLGGPPRYATQYLGQGQAFPRAYADQAAAHGTELVLQVEPGMSMNDVAGGYEDWWLDELAQQIHAFGRPVIVSYAEEANGNWSDWGWTRTAPQQYQAAWKHVLRVLRQDENITWMDTLNTSYPGSGPLADYLVPGVSVIGLDAYFFNRDDTFGTVFAPTLAHIRQLTAKPVLISETAAGPSIQARVIPGLVSGARQEKLAGIIWFNQKQGTDIYHQDWTLTPAGAAAFRLGA